LQLFTVTFVKRCRYPESFAYVNVSATEDVTLFNCEFSTGVVIKLTGGGFEDQSNIGTASVSQDLLDQAALDDNY